MTATGHRPVPVFLVESPSRLAPGTVLTVMLEQVVYGLGYRADPGPHGVGRAEVMSDGQLAIWLTGSSEAGRTARGLLADDILDVVVEGDPPTVRLRP